MVRGGMGGINRSAARRHRIAAPVAGGRSPHSARVSPARRLARPASGRESPRPGWAGRDRDRAGRRAEPGSRLVPATRKVNERCRPSDLFKREPHERDDLVPKVDRIQRQHFLDGRSSILSRVNATR